MYTIPNLIKFCVAYSSCVRIVQSERVGMGKSLYILRLAEDLTGKYNVTEPLTSIRVHGPSIDEDRIMDQLQSLRVQSSKTLIVHFDISPSVSSISQPLFSCNNTSTFFCHRWSNLLTACCSQFLFWAVSLTFVATFGEGISLTCMQLKSHYLLIWLRTVMQLGACCNFYLQ